MSYLRGVPMVKIEFVHKLKSIIDDKGSCYTKTTEKKGEGFIPYNVHDMKWGRLMLKTLE